MTIDKISSGGGEVLNEPAMGAAYEAAFQLQRGLTSGALRFPARDSLPPIPQQATVGYHIPMSRHMDNEIYVLHTDGVLTLDVRIRDPRSDFRPDGHDALLSWVTRYRSTMATFAPDEKTITERPVSVRTLMLVDPERPNSAHAGHFHPVRDEIVGPPKTRAMNPEDDAKLATLLNNLIDVGKKRAHRLSRMPAWLANLIGTYGVTLVAVWLSVFSFMT